MTTQVDRLDALERRMDEWEAEWAGVLGSGDPLGAAQRLMVGRRAQLAEAEGSSEKSEEKAADSSKNSKTPKGGARDK